MAKPTRTGFDRGYIPRKPAPVAPVAAPAPWKPKHDDARIAAILAPKPEPRHPLEDTITPDTSPAARDAVHRVVARERERAPFRAEALRLARLNVSLAETEMRLACAKARKKPSYCDHVEFRIDGEITASSATYVRRQLTMSPRARQITVHIDSTGGSLGEAYKICGLLRGHPATVTMFARRFCQSAAFTIFMAGDRRIADRGCEFLVHRISFPGTTKDAWTAEHHGRTEGEIAYLREQWAACGADLDGFGDLFARGERDEVFSAAEALARGVVHRVEALFALDRPAPRWTPPATAYAPDADIDPDDDNGWPGDARYAGHRFDISAGDILGLPAIVPDWVTEALTEAGLPCSR